MGASTTLVWGKDLHPIRARYRSLPCQPCLACPPMPVPWRHPTRRCPSSLATSYYPSHLSFSSGKEAPGGDRSTHQLASTCTEYALSKVCTNYQLSCVYMHVHTYLDAKWPRYLRQYWQSYYRYVITPTPAKRVIISTPFTDVLGWSE